MPTSATFDNAALADRMRPPPRLTVTWAADIQPHLTGRYIVKGLLPSDALIQVIGEPNCGKSAVAIDLSCHVGVNRAWRKRRVRGGPVAYFALEARHSVENRIEAWCRHYGVSRADVQVAVVGGSLDLRDPASVGEAIALLRVQAKARGAFVTVVLDTQARATPGANENSAEDMGAIIAACDRIRAELGVSVILVHHVGKDATRGARGHSSQLGAVDVQIEIASRQIKETKVRESAAGVSIPFDLVPVHLGDDEDGDPVTAVVAVESTGKPRAAGKPPTGYAATALRAYDDLLADGKGRTSPGTSAVPKGKRYLMLEDWRARFLRYVGTEQGEEKANKAAWRDAKKALTEKGVILIDGQVAWKP